MPASSRVQPFRRAAGRHCVTDLLAESMGLRKASSQGGREGVVP